MDKFGAATAVAATPPDDLKETVRRALREDVGAGDLSAALIPAGRCADAAIVCREAAVMCGAPWVAETFRQVDAAIRIEWRRAEGDELRADEVVCRLYGPARGLLTGERTALNFLQTLCATATLARRCVHAAGDGVRILDTRKTLPGLRTAQKYAVRVGGAHNHRMGLFDAFLIKENHLLAEPSIAASVVAARACAPGRLVEVEVESPAQLREAVAAGCDRVLLDNFSVTELRDAVRLVAGRVAVEASGGVTLENIGAVAATGVDFISLGRLTKNVRAVDLSMRFERETTPH